MIDIIPYIKDIKESDGAFVFSDNRVKLVNSHIKYAQEYIKGKDFNILFNIQDKGYTEEWEKHKQESFNIYVKEHNLPWKSREDIDPCISSALNNKEKILFNKWVEQFEFGIRIDMYSDFLLYILGIDKIQTIKRKCIVTTHPYPYIRYYNYLLMGFEIDLHNPMKYNEDTKEFEHYRQDRNIIAARQNGKYLDEIEDLKNKVPIMERHLFFK